MCEQSAYHSVPGFSLGLLLSFLLYIPAAEMVSYYNHTTTHTDQHQHPKLTHSNSQHSQHSQSHSHPLVPTQHLQSLTLSQISNMALTPLDLTLSPSSIAIAASLGLAMPLVANIVPIQVCDERGQNGEL